MISELQDTLTPYKELERDLIQYTYCYDYDHISRYRGLRQVVHQGSSPDRCMTLETANAFSTTSDLVYYTVPEQYENRLDLIARDLLGSASYAWVIAYFNGISDGFTVHAGAELQVPPSITSLFQNGECLASVTATKLNLGCE